MYMHATEILAMKSLVTNHMAYRRKNREIAWSIDNKQKIIEKQKSSLTTHKNNQMVIKTKGSLQRPLVKEEVCMS